MASNYARRYRRTMESVGETLIDENMQRALAFREQGMSLRKAAKEARVSRDRLSAIEFAMNQEFAPQVGVARVEPTYRADDIGAFQVHGTRRQISYVREYKNPVFVDLDEKNASLNASYMNYVRWGIYSEEKDEVGEGKHLVERATDNVANQMGKFVTLVSVPNQRKFHALAVYKTTYDRKRKIMVPVFPADDTDVDLHWETLDSNIVKMEAQRAGSNLAPYARV